MKYFFYLLIFFTTHIYAKSGEERGNVRYQLFEQQGKVGIRDSAGNVIIPAEYEALGWSKGELRIVKDVVGFKSKGQWGIINLKNQIVATARYTRLYPGNSSVLVAGITGKFSQRDFLGLISIKGEVVLPFKYASIKQAGLRAIVSVKEGRRYLFGVVDLSDRIIIPLSFKDISFLGSLRFAVNNFEGKTAIFNEKGEQIIDFELDSISEYNRGLAIVYNNHLRGLINPNGQLVKPIKSKDFNLSGGIKSLDFNTWNIIDSGNKKNAQFHYDSVSPYGSGIMKVEANGKQWLINATGDALTPQHYDELGPQINHLIPFRKGFNWGIIKRSGNILMPPRLDTVFVNEDLIYAKEKIGRGLKWSVYDTFGIRKSMHYYDTIRDRADHLIAVSRQGYWGFIDRTGEEVIHCVYDDVTDFVDGLAVVKFHKKFGVIDKSGSWIALPQDAAIQIINRSYYLTKGDSLTTLRSFDKGSIYFTKNPVKVKEGYLIEQLSGGGIWKIDFSGRILNELSDQAGYEELRTPSEGFYAVKINGKYGFIDAQNRLRIANRYDDVGPFSEGLAAVNLIGHWGFIDKRERIVVQPIYNSPSAFQNGLAIVENDQGMGLITSTGEKACSFEYNDIKRLKNGRLLVQKNDKYGLISENGELLVNAKYEELRDLNNGFAIIKRFGKYGLVDLHGVDIIPVIYDQLYYDALNNNYLGMKKSSWEDVRLP